MTTPTHTTKAQKPFTQVVATQAEIERFGFSTNPLPERFKCNTCGKRMWGAQCYAHPCNKDQ
jgi:hypothetical protein